MPHIRTKIFSNGTTAISAVTDSDPPFDFSAAERGSVVIKASNFTAVGNTLVADVWWGVRERGLLSNKANITWVKDTTLTTTVTSAGTAATAQVGLIPITQMKSPLMKVVFTPSASARVTAYFEYNT